MTSLPSLEKYVILYPRIIPLRSNSGGGSHCINKLVDDVLTPVRSTGIALGAIKVIINNNNNNNLV